ncbi:MAG: hypothetical protein AABY84_05000 [Candidatus Firestonebacteria bacterium]
MGILRKKKIVEKNLPSLTVPKSKTKIKIPDKKVETPSNLNPIDEAKLIIEKILELANLDAKVIIKNADTIEASGKDSAIIIGRNGTTLFAIDTLLNSILNKNKANKIKFVFDVEEYRQRYPNKTLPVKGQIDQHPLNQAPPAPINPYNRNPYNSSNYNKKTPYSTTNYNYYTKTQKRSSLNQTNNLYKPYTSPYPSPYRQNNNGKYNSNNLPQNKH